MGIVAIVPAKASSTRVPNKNYRPFWDDLSLVDLLLAKLTRVLPGDRVFLSCEDESKASFATRWDAQFVLRHPALCDNSVPYCDVIRGVCNSVPGHQDVLWCQAIDPFFDQHAAVLERWYTIRHEDCDSLTVVYPNVGYVLDQNHHPIGFGFGPWHVPSQKLPIHYRLNFTCAVLTRHTIAQVGYLVGSRPAWYEAPNVFLDIDTEEDFELAQLIYGHTTGKRQR